MNSEDIYDFNYFIANSKPTNLFKEVKKSINKKEREIQFRADSDWSTISSQVVGAETF
jgi:hypothetical protein